jgi:hypothetical protein
MHARSRHFESGRERVLSSRAALDGSRDDQALRTSMVDVKFDDVSMPKTRCGHATS